MKNNSFLKVYTLIMVLGTLVLGFLIFKGRSDFNGLTDKFETQKDQVNRLQSGQLFPNESNLEEKQERVTAYVGAVDKLKAKVLEGQAPLKEDLQEQDFRQIMNNESEAIVALAAKAKLILPENFAFGLDAYKQGKPFRAGAISRLEWQLNAAKEFIKIAADSDIDSVDEFNRDEFKEENEAAESKEGNGSRTGRSSNTNRNKSSINPMAEADKVMETYRFTTEITGSYESLTTFLNGLAANRNSFLWVRKVRIENENQKSPRVGEISLPVPVAGAVPDDDGKTAEIDAAVLFGNEKMRARIVIDAVRFKGELAVSEDKETASS
jgi:hypothetical protein